MVKIISGGDIFLDFDGEDPFWFLVFIFYSKLSGGACAMIFDFGSDEVI